MCSSWRHPETVPLSLRCAVPACRIWRHNRRKHSAPERTGPACTTHPVLINQILQSLSSLERNPVIFLELVKRESKRCIIPFESF
ncbi:hypothetical protein EUGRSUZ_L00193 [Eucalyptus grandis]|uniref:Uncharacterized protein n=1 Tax=Eucalyptus grandis TaxID=71139 RepID=A0A058ZW00_EUCGR|nr:hypothetical protein EUGRSUZ_L00193 [Eucalyptus grandis]